MTKQGRKGCHTKTAKSILNQSPKRQTINSYSEEKININSKMTCYPINKRLLLSNKKILGREETQKEL
tara:strand:- start:162 stop:365 length:204 start_codon:yes stop_codon:yes gene_type:complete